MSALAAAPVPGGSDDLIPPAGALRTRDEWRLFKLTSYPDGHVQKVFMFRGCSRAEVLELAGDLDGWGFLPARWLLQRVYVCEVYGEAREVGEGSLCGMSPGGSCCWP